MAHGGIKNKLDYQINDNKMYVWNILLLLGLYPRKLELDFGSNFSKT